MKHARATTSINKVIRKSVERGFRKQVWLVLIGFGVLLLAVGTWTHHAVNETINDNINAVLKTLLQANIEALQIVVENERGQVQSWARDYDLRVLTEQLMAGGELSEIIPKLNEILAGVMAEDGYLGYIIIDGNGLIRATDHPDTYLGKTLSPTALKALAPLLAEESSFEKPFAISTLINERNGISNRPVLMAKAPITDLTGNINAALVFTIDPEKDFTRILSVAQFGRSGNTYAFDDKGVMLSESRHEQQLKQLGLIPDTPQSSAILTLQVRDPGVDLTTGKRPEQPPSAWPLTRMVQEAVSGHPGINAEGYRDYRGVEVVGAWQWLDGYGFGVATEVARSEALRGLRPVRVAFVGLLVLLVVTTGGFLAAGFFFQRLQKEVDVLRELGQYTLVEKIGEGGMGKVYKARHALLRRPTAIKLIREDLLDEKALTRFEQEVQLTSQLTHPNTISIYDYGHSPDGIFYYAMEYLPGITLGQLVEIEQQLPPERVIYILRQICGSLAEAHAQGLIHRDIKPGNIMLCQRGGDYDFVKVLDFGLVHEIKPRIAAGSEQHELLGTPGFLAPELLLAAGQVDARSDIYAVGALGFLMLTGQLVFNHRNVDELLRVIVNSDPPRPSECTDQQIPRDIDDLIYACLARGPEQRPTSANELLLRLDKISLKKTWTTQEASGWWQDKAGRIAYQRKLGRTESSAMSETGMAIDFGERS